MNQIHALLVTAPEQIHATYDISKAGNSLLPWLDYGSLPVTDRRRPSAALSNGWPYATGSTHLTSKPSIPGSVSWPFR